LTGKRGKRRNNLWGSPNKFKREGGLKKRFHIKGEGKNGNNPFSIGLIVLSAVFRKRGKRVRQLLVGVGRVHRKDTKKEKKKKG